MQKHCFALDKVLKALQTHRRSVVFMKMDVCEKLLDALSDSAFKREGTSGYSLRGALYLRRGRRQGKSVVHLLLAECKSLSLVAISKYATELLGCETAIDRGFIVLIILQEFMFGPLPAHDIK